LFALAAVLGFENAYNRTMSRNIGSCDVGLENPHVVIVGAGFAGLRAARSLRKAPVRITIVDRNNHHLFQPLLYQVATAGLSPAEIAHPIRSVVRKQDNIEVLMGEVVDVDAEARDVILGNGRRLRFDYLILATGALYNYFGNDEWEIHAPSLKTISDATLIRRKILLAFELAEVESDPVQRQALLTFIIVGGGPTGVELAGSVAELAHRALASDFCHIDPAHARIMLVEAAPRILNTFPEKLAAKAHRELERLGVEVRTGLMVKQVDASGVIVNEERIDAETVVWAAGVKASAAAKWLGADTDRIGRAIVEADLSIPGHSNIFVVGDTAYVKDPDGKPLPGVAPVAMQQGTYVGHAIQDRVNGESRSRPFAYRDKGNLATVGRAFAIADVGRLKLSGLFAWLLWVVVHIFYLVDFQNRVLVLTQWFWSYVTFERGARLIIMDETLPVKNMQETPSPQQKAESPAHDASALGAEPSHSEPPGGGERTSP
jgi:NADH:ubiquinone reductase (H+-translocating)